jgi:hypothetical protein
MGEYLKVFFFFLFLFPRKLFDLSSVMHASRSYLSPKCSTLFTQSWCMMNGTTEFPWSMLSRVGVKKRISWLGCQN